jgi:hypothetical protein
MRCYTAIEAVSHASVGERTSVFIAGSIEQDRAENWQLKVLNLMAAHPGTDRFVAFNPRRANWDASMDQSIDNPEFTAQVNWELDQLKLADITFFYFQPGTLSPISLLELGLVCGEGLADLFPVIVVCPEGFWRRANVQIVCQRAGITCYASLEDGLAELQKTLTCMR